MGLVALAALVGCSKPEPETPGTQALGKLITAKQYRNSLEYIFGPGIHLQVQMPPVPRTEGLLANTAATAGVSGGLVQDLQSVAASVAGQVVDMENRNHLIPCRPASIEKADEACATQFVTKVGRLLFRRAMTDEEVSLYVDQAGAAAEQLENFYDGLEVALEGLLLSPVVLFII